MGVESPVEAWVGARPPTGPELERNRQVGQILKAQIAHNPAWGELTAENLTASFKIFQALEAVKPLSELKELARLDWRALFDDDEFRTYTREV